MSLHRIIRWQSEEDFGLEHMELRQTDWGYLAQSTIIGTFEGTDFSCRYELTLDPNWTFRHLVLEKTDGKVLILRSDGMGAWERANGEALPQFEGCIDIDIGATPFTNTLPIRRARLEAGVPQHFRMVWVPLDSLEPFVDEQIYTRRDDTHFHYAAADGSFAADITVDADGLVVDYPGLYHRI
jgi:uncharacterized protein